MEKLKDFVNFYVPRSGHFNKSTEMSYEKITPLQKEITNISRTILKHHKNKLNINLIPILEEGKQVW